MLNFSIYCKRHYSEDYPLFKAGIESLIKDSLKEPHANVVNALAVGIEQASERIYLSSDSENLALDIVRSFDHIHYRSIPGGIKIWTIGMDWQEPIIVQIRCISNEPIVERIAMALSLILYSSRSLVEKVISDLGVVKKKDFRFT